MDTHRPSYTGRFAPSPSGPLHLGSLVAALGSWLDARAARGRWLLRIEDLDTPRNAPGAEQGIVRCLRVHGLEWDGALERQSAWLPRYALALQALQRAEHCYACACTRREVEEAGGVYPGTCRQGTPAGRPARAARLRCPPGRVAFEDRLRGRLEQDVAGEVGDFVLKRADGIFAYQLACVVDDGAQGVTDIVRGADLLESTARQCVLQRLLGLAQPRYLHLPLVLLPDGRKLSKQNHAPGLEDGRAGRNLLDALALLGQELPTCEAGSSPPPRQVLDWAIARWRPASIGVAAG